MEAQGEGLSGTAQCTNAPYMATGSLLLFYQFDDCRVSSSGVFFARTRLEYLESVELAQSEVMLLVVAVTSV